MELGQLVDDHEWLYRSSRLPEKKYLNPDGSATSRVFKLREKDQGKLSVDVKSMTSAEKSVGDKNHFFLFELPNKAVLGITNPQLSTYHDPLPDGSNDAHAVITGMTIEDDITPALLAKASRKVFF
jgi:hypothetical protein